MSASDLQPGADAGRSPAKARTAELASRHAADASGSGTSGPPADDRDACKVASSEQAATTSPSSVTRATSPPGRTVPSGPSSTSTASITSPSVLGSPSIGIMFCCSSPARWTS